MPCPTVACLSKTTIQTIGCYDHGGAVSCTLRAGIVLKYLSFRDEFSRGRVILKRFRINWSRNWKTGCKSCYSSTLEFWHYSVYSTYTPQSSLRNTRGGSLVVPHDRRKHLRPGQEVGTSWARMSLTVLGGASPHPESLDSTARAGQFPSSPP